MKRIILYCTVLIMALSANLQAQNDYYYFGDKKIDMIKNDSLIAIRVDSISGVDWNSIVI